MYNRNYSKTESFQDLMSRLYPASELSPEVRERVLYDENGKPRKFVARTCTFQVTDDCNLRCSYCLAAGTKIRMGDYTEKNIEDVKAGDIVLAFNEVLGATTYMPATVDQLFEREVDSYYIIDTDTRYICITGNHKVVATRADGALQWIEAEKLVCGDALCYHHIFPNGNERMMADPIISIKRIDAKTKVYNIGTSTHTYIANDIMVHNCYQICKQHHVMDFETAKKFADMILEANLDNNEYIDVETSPGIVFEFIGGEPFMAIDLIQKISDYIVDKMIKMNHPWKNKFMFSICSNGVLYKDKRVQAYMQKYKYNLSFSISIDGNKELHDSCRVFPDGSGSYDIAIAGVEHFREHYNGKMGSKMTMAPSNISYVFEAVKNLIALKYDEIFLNCVYEKGWEAHHATELYGQFKKLTDYIIDNDYFDKIFLSYFDDTQFKPMAECENDNWCGGTGSMISCDYKGDIYPCIRYMESSIGEGIKPLKIGNVNDGVMHTDETIDCVHCLRNISRRSQSTDECFNCPIAGACSWCSAYNYQENGTADKRCTYICIMHKGRALANIYYWNKGFRKYAPWFRFASWIPKQWALEIISEEEYDMLMDLIKFDESDLKRIQEMLDNNEVPEEYIPYAMTAIESKKAAFTNDLAPIATKTFKEDGTPAYDMNYNEEVSEDDLYDVTEQAYAGTFNFIEDQNFDIQAVDYLKELHDESTNSAIAWMGGTC